MDKDVVYMCACVCLCTYIYIHIHRHTHNGILLSHKKERNIAVFSNMDGTMELENIILGEVSQTDKNKYYMISLICGI